MCGQLKVRFLSRALFTLRKLGVSLRSWRPRGLVNFFLQAPTRKLARVRDTWSPASMRFCCTSPSVTCGVQIPDPNQQTGGFCS